MNQFIYVYELMNLYLYYNSDKKTSPEYTLKLQNQYKTTFFFPTVIRGEIYYCRGRIVKNSKEIKAKGTK